jgi:hypothetical protein
MLHAKQASKRKRRSKAVPVLGAAGLSLSPASGASAAIGGTTTNMLTRNSGVSHEITLCEEEISDVSLATFYVFESETFRSGIRLAAGGGCGCTCGIGCGGPTTTDYGPSKLGAIANPPPRYSIKPAHKYARAPKRAHVQKNP